MAENPHPAYLRLGRDEKPADFVLPDYAPWRHLLAGEKGVLVVAGPGAGGFLAALCGLAAADRPDLWVVTELPVEAGSLPAPFVDKIAAGAPLYVLEEHVAQGGLGQMLAHALLLRGTAPKSFRHFHAKGYLSGRYGSQNFHRAENDIDPASVLRAIGAAAA